MNILSVENLAKTVKDEPLFENVYLGLEEGEKAGIVGLNGTGKSTFLRCLAGVAVPDEGKVSIRSDASLVMLEQAVSFPEGTTLSGFLHLQENRALRILSDYQKALSDGNEREYTRLMQIAEKEDLWSIEREYRAMLTELGVEESMDKEMAALSGGEQKKAAIARALALRPDLLLLDEPTNHLDIRSIEYLEKWISSSPAAVVIVTHDRSILDRCCTSIWELDRRHFHRHPGSFSAYLERKEERMRMDERREERIEAILRRELEWLKRGPKARTGKDKGRKDRISEMLGRERTRREEKPREFSSAERRQGIEDYCSSGEPCKY